MELELQQLQASGSVQARVFEAAGGYAPTLGILGAVLGLIQVMNYLTEPSKLGPGIALAFVATVYGVGSANLIFLPISHKFRLRHQRQLLLKELALEGVVAISLGENPRLIEEKLTGLLAGMPLQGTPPPQPQSAPETRENILITEPQSEASEYATSPVSQT
jgi:chemotaxis protein MotA